MAGRTGRPFSRWRDWTGRAGTVYQMGVWHDATRSSLYKRATRLPDGTWLLNPPKRPRTDRPAA
jgi:hypothetical protein